VLFLLAKALALVARPARKVAVLPDRRVAACRPPRPTILRVLQPAHRRSQYDGEGLGPLPESYAECLGIGYVGHSSSCSASIELLRGDVAP
jgi:hypothetical protein